MDTGTLLIDIFFVAPVVIGMVIVCGLVMYAISPYKK